MKKIIIINGPNLNLLGKREPHIYGEKTFEGYFEEIQSLFKSSVDLSLFQSNHEGEIIDKLHQTGFSFDGIIMNAGALSHTSLAIADAIAAIDTPVLEVHISNIHAREEFREKTVTGNHCVGIITGLGLYGYTAGIHYFLQS